MRKYYLHSGSGQQGPFSTEEIGQLNVLPETLVWTDGMDRWMPAKDLPELAHLLKAPPPLPVDAMNDGDGVPPITAVSSRKKYAIGSLVLSVVAAVISIIIFFGKVSKPVLTLTADSAAVTPLTADTAVVLPQSAIEPPPADPAEEAKISESQAPGKYLIINTAIEKNMLLQPVIKGTIFNKATVTTYETIRLRISYSGKDGALIGEEYLDIEDRLAPGELAEIRHKPSRKAYRKAAAYKVSLQAALAAG